MWDSQKKAGHYFIFPCLAAAAIFLTFLPSSRAEENICPEVENTCPDTVKATPGNPLHIVLDKTWEPRSGEIIDCRGGWILPRKLADGNHGVSEPDTLIFLGEEVEGVQIRNCRLDASFPIVIAGGGRHRITGNDIRSHSISVYLFGGEQVMIDHNRIRSTGRNVQILYDSNYTWVCGNQIDYQAGGPVVGGTPGFIDEDSPGQVGLAVYSYPGVDYLVINNRLIQVLTNRDTRPCRTVVQENTINMRPGTGVGIAFATRSSHSLAQGNTIIGGDTGLGVFGWGDDVIFHEPGLCSEDPEIACNPEEEDKCEFFGAGLCVGAVPVEGGGRVVAPTMIDNRVSGAWFAGFLGGFGENTLLESNDFQHNQIGILLSDYMLSDYQFGISTTVRGNVASRNDIGLRLADDYFSGFEEPALDLSYNDFGNNTQVFDARTREENADGELIAIHPYLKPTTLPNNWWGSDPCGFPQNQEMWPNVVDPFAAAFPIAEAWRAGESDAVPRCDIE